MRKKAQTTSNSHDNFATRIIFDCETAVGQCDLEEGDSIRFAKPCFSTIFAHTHASLSKGLLKIEQHCYLRHGEEVPEQPWVRPQITLEPALGTESEMIESIKLLHKRFLTEVPKQFPEWYLPGSN